MSDTELQLQDARSIISDFITLSEGVFQSQNEKETRFALGVLNAFCHICRNMFGADAPEPQEGER